MKNDIFSNLSSDVVKEIIENSPTGIYVNDLKGKLLYGNKKAEKIVGYERSELIGQNIKNIVLLDAAGMAKAAKLLAMNVLGKETGPDEFELKKKDGTKSTVIIRTNPIRIGNKKLVVGMVEDITERKKLEIELKKRNEELEKTVKFSVGRELEMVRLKKEIENLKKKVKTSRNG